MTITQKSGSVIAAFILFAVVAIATLFNTMPASANPLGFFRTSAVDGVATTNPAYMTAGTATTTKYYDTGSGNALAADNATFALQFIGSSTASTAKVQFEYANTPANGANCRTSPTYCDWYGDTIYPVPVSTTTPAMTLNVTTSFLVPFASTTVGGAAGSAATTTRLINVPTPTRYIRAVITLPVGSLNGAVWGEFIGKKQS